MQNQKKILLVEDEKDARDLYEEILSFAGYLVDTATDGEMGLEKAKQGGYALIILDLMMPKLDGISILKSLKKKPPKTTNGPIIVLTNLAHDPVLEEALSVGASECIIKTDINPDLLTEKVRRLIQ